MKTIAGVIPRIWFIWFAMVLVSPGVAFGQQPSLSRLQSEIISSWIVTVDGESRTRTLRITEAAPKPDGTLLLEALYGWTDGKVNTPVRASVSQSEPGAKLFVTTQADSQIVAAQTSASAFEGTFTDKKGVVKTVRIQKVSEEELQSKIAAAKAARAAQIIVKPAADVPASCSALSGQWTGTWRIGGVQRWLWIVEIDAKCVAKFAYLSHPNPPTGFARTQIEDAAISIDNRSAGTRILFQAHPGIQWVTG